MTLGADADRPLAAVVLGLVRLGPINPNVARGVHVARTHDTDLDRAGQPLQPDHVGHDLGHVRQRSVDNVVGHRAGSVAAVRPFCKPVTVARA